MAGSKAASFFTLDPAQDWTEALHGDLARHLEQEALPAFLPMQRWYAAKDKRLTGVTLQPWTTLNDDAGDYVLAAVDLTFADGASQSYLLPLTLRAAETDSRSSSRANTVAIVARQGGEFGLLDAAADPAFALALLRRLQSTDDLSGPLRCEATDALKRISPPPPAECHRPTEEQSNVSFVMGNVLLFKLYRRLRPGVQPEIEVSRFLTETSFANTPPYLGAIAYAPPGANPVPIAAGFGFVANRGNAWDALLAALREEFAGRATPPADAAASLDLVRTIGASTADMHCAFASATKDPAFAVEPVAADDLRQWTAQASEQAERAFAAAGNVRRELNDGDAAADIDALLARAADIRSRIERFAALPPSGVKTRHHGDYHLGQVLVGEGDVYIIDFEGEPLRSLDERRAKTDPARDLAGMLRSFDYLAATATEGTGTSAPALAWRHAAEAQFLQAYAKQLKDCRHWPAATGSSLDRLELFLIEKALYEISYEAANRPGWIGIPVAGALRLLDEAFIG